MGKRKVTESVKDGDNESEVNQRNGVDEDVKEDRNDSKGNNNDKLAEFDAETEFKKLFAQAKKMGLTSNDLGRLTILEQIAWDGSWTRVILKYTAVLFVLLLVIYVGVFLVIVSDWPIGRQSIAQTWMDFTEGDLDYDLCMVEMPEFVADAFRPPVDCEYCKGMTEIKTVYNISQDEFEELYAYTGVPVVIGDGTFNWTAPEYFSFEFFKEIYKDGSQALENQERKCQFFPYKTSFMSLSEVLNMRPERAKMEDGSEPWYIGWSNCDSTAANILRKHYKRPYFLPKLSESSKTDWMFMGSPGYGAHLHIDHVGNPSWQAQITGTKRWTLEPPSECYYVCPDKLEVIIHPGQIIVIDTDIWFHSTLNVGNDISITIGSEYD